MGALRLSSSANLQGRCSRLSISSNTIAGANNVDGADNVDGGNKPTEKRPGCMQLDDMHVALVSLAVHLLHSAVKTLYKKKMVDDTVLAHHRSHGKRWNWSQVSQLHTKLC